MLDKITLKKWPKALAMLPLLMMGLTSNPEIGQAPELTFAMGLLPDLQAWVKGAPLNDPDLAEKAVRTFAEAIQKLEITSSADIRALDFDAFMVKANSLTGTVKEILATYDVDLNAFLDSMKATSSSKDMVSLSMHLLGKDRSLDVPMVEMEGKMIPKLAAELIKQQMLIPEEMGDSTPELEAIPETPSAPLEVK